MNDTSNLIGLSSNGGFRTRVWRFTDNHGGPDHRVALDLLDPSPCRGDLKIVLTPSDITRLAGVLGSAIARIRDDLERDATGELSPESTPVSTEVA